MFSDIDFESYINSNLELFDLIEQYILEDKLGIDRIKYDDIILVELSYFSGAVLGYIAMNGDINTDRWEKIIKKAADIEFILYKENYKFNRFESVKGHLLRASILYEFIGYYSISAILGKYIEYGTFIKGFLSRENKNGFGRFGIQLDQLTTNNSNNLIENALEVVFIKLAMYMQAYSNDINYINKSLDLLRSVLSTFNYEIKQDEIICLKKLVQKRIKAAVINFVSKDVLYDLIIAKTPTELWKSQIMAIEGGILSEEIDSLGIATPTGTGKTLLAQVTLISFFKAHKGKKAFYVVPSKALATQVSRDLADTLIPLGYNVAALGSHLTFDLSVFGDPKDADLLIFTPEKADLILRIERDLLKDVDLVIIDEAHHIEAGTRGILLEFYLWRIKNMVSKECRIIQLSAVAPNINELVTWLTRRNASNSVKLDWRPGKFRIGTYEKENNEGILSFDTVQPVTYTNYYYSPEDESTDIDIINLGCLAHTLSKNGLVLILSTSKPRAEKIAYYIKCLRNDFLEQKKDSELTYNMESLDAKLERELYAEVPLRNSISFGVAYHHSGLPSRVRFAVEQVIKEKKVNIVCATTTLAEGVNFPFSTVIVESLIIGKSTQLTPRELWNVAGRAGRYGVDIEGHCILYRPSRYSKKLKVYNIEDYLNIALDSIPKVNSALADAINELDLAMTKCEFSESELSEISLDSIKTKLKGNNKKLVVGMINMYRVGLIHATANGLINIESNDSIIQDMLAYRKLDSHKIELISKVELCQRRMIRESFLHNDDLLNIAARIGWSLETQNNLLLWIKSLENWQIVNMNKVIYYNGQVNENQLNYILYPVAERMTEFEGTKLGGFTSYIAREWILGYSITDIRQRAIYKGERYDYDKLVDVIYSRIQYLLPWALYGVNDLINYEAGLRGIKMGSSIRDLSILSSEGVPNFHALNLCIQLDIERVDATRLSNEYMKFKKTDDIIKWFKESKWFEIERIVKGNDNRRLDPDLKLKYDSK